MPESPRGIRNATSEAPLFYLNMSEKKKTTSGQVHMMDGEGAGRAAGEEGRGGH